MPLPMRRQTSLAKQGDLRDAQESSRSSRRIQAADDLRKGVPIRTVAENHGITKTTAGRLSKAIKAKCDIALQKLLNPKDNRRGARTVWALAEAQELNKKVKEAGQRGFAVDAPLMKTMLKRLSMDGRKGYKDQLPSDDALRTYRAMNRDLTFRRTENKDAAKLRAENHEHVFSFADQLRKVGKRHPGILEDPDRVLNMDETHVDAEFGHRVKAFTSASSHHGGYVGVQKGSGKHLTALLVATASGKLAPLFAIAAGKSVMEAWTEPLPKQYFTDENGIPHWLTNTGCIPQDTVVRCTENGSVEADILPAVIKHLDRFVRQFVPREKAILLILVGHKFRKGIQWIEEALKCNIEVVTLPANTTHFLQPCDNMINKTFQKTVRDTRDTLLKMASTNVHSMGFKLKLAVAGCAGISSQNVRDSFVHTGIWPINYRFVAKSSQNINASPVLNAADQIMQGGPSSGVRSVQVRRNDIKTLEKLKLAFGSSQNATSKIASLQTILSEHETVSVILQGIRPVQHPIATGCGKRVLGCEAPSECLTIRELFELRKKKKAEAEAALERKKHEKIEKRRQKAVEKVKKEAQKEQARMERERQERLRAAQKAAQRAVSPRKRRKKTALGAENSDVELRGVSESASKDAAATSLSLAG